MIGILLAAGFSRRFGAEDKLLQRLPDGRPVALAAAENMVKALPRTIAVLRPENKTLADLLQSAGLTIVFCGEHEQEMADSLAAAVRFAAGFSEADDGFVIALADMPYISPATITTVAARIGSGADIAVPTHHGQRGHPVGFAAKFRNALEKLHGDEGARAILKRHADAIQFIALDDAGIVADIDTPEDLLRQV